MRQITLSFHETSITVDGDDGTHFDVQVPVASSGWYHIASAHTDVDGAPEVQIMARRHSPVAEIVKNSRPAQKKRWWQR